MSLLGTASCIEARGEAVSAAALFDPAQKVRTDAPRIVTAPSFRTMFLSMEVSFRFRRSVAERRFSTVSHGNRHGKHLLMEPSRRYVIRLARAGG
jgi:hypothetical protein